MSVKPQPPLPIKRHEQKNGAKTVIRRDKLTPVYPYPLPRKGWGPALCIGLLLSIGACSQNPLVEKPQDTVPLHQPGDRKLSCRELDRQVQELYRRAVRLAPKGFHEDQSNTAAAAVGTFAFTPAYLHILHNELMHKPKQRMRIEAVTERIELLQRYKAERHCYESR